MIALRSLILALVLSASIAPAFAQAAPPVPALPDTERRTSYVISGSTCACNVNFQLYGDSTDVANWLTVYINGVQIPQSGNWNITSPSGPLANLPRPISNAVLTFTTAQTGTVQIVGAQRPRRTSQVAENRGVAARDFNQVISSLTAQLRENWDKTNDVTGRAVIAPPGETLAMLPKLASRANMGACFDSGGNLVPCVSAGASTFSAGNGITLTGVSPTSIAANLSASAPIVMSGTNPIQFSCPTCNTSAPPTAPTYPTRTAAAALDLSAYSVVTTQGYATAGDGGGATFLKTSARFLDTVVTSGSITNAGTGYTTGTYLYVALTGSATGIATYANVTVAGGVVTSVVILDVNGRGAASLVGDVLTTPNTNIGGTGTGFTWTVGAVTTALASFTDSVGNRFQFVVSNGQHINPRQFGCKFDWLGVDATATDDGACIQASLNFASITKYARQDFGGTLASTRVMLPAGSAKICQGLVVPGATQLFGQGPFNSILKWCDSGLATNTHLITVCDINAHIACFGPQIGQLGINSFNAASVAGTYAIFSNAAQQTRYLDNVNIYSGTRGCIGYDVGYGGAALVTMYDLFCTINTGSANAGVNMAAGIGTTIIKMFNFIVESGGAGLTGNGINLLAGQVHIDGLHVEGITTAINVNMTVATHSAVVMNSTGGSNCTQFAALQAANTLGNFAIFNTVKQGACTNLVLNGQPAGSNRAADARPKDGWVFFNP